MKKKRPKRLVSKFIRSPVSKDDLEKRITDCLFKVVGSSLSEVKKICVKPGDEIRGDDGRLYSIQHSHPPIILRTPIKVEPILIYELIPYPYYKGQKTPTLRKGISAQDFIQELTSEVNEFLKSTEFGDSYRNTINEDYVLKQLHKETISRDERKRTRIYDWLSSPSHLREHKTQLMHNLLSILQNSINGIDKGSMTVFYLSKILFAAGIEKGSLKDIERNIQFKYRTLIKS